MRRGGVARPQAIVERAATLEKTVAVTCIQRIARGKRGLKHGSLDQLASSRFEVSQSCRSHSIRVLTTPEEVVPEEERHACFQVTVELQTYVCHWSLYFSV